MKYKHMLAIDPSGNFHEGKGTTGWVLMNYKSKLITTGFISASKFECPEEYWNEILKLIELNANKYGDELIVVIEDYLLYETKATAQVNSRMETCRLLGTIQWFCWINNIPYSLQPASAVKHRWSDEVLLKEQIFYKDSDGLHHTDTGWKFTIIHIRDAFRHAIHYITCRNEEKPKPPKKRTVQFENYTGEHYV